MTLDYALINLSMCDLNVLNEWFVMSSVWENIFVYLLLALYNFSCDTEP